MNDILSLKGPFKQKEGKFGGGPAKLPKGAVVRVEHLENLKNNLKEMIEFWDNQKFINGALVSVYYNKVAAKSNRISGFLSHKGKSALASIVGSKFSDINDNHIITHYIPIGALYNSIMVTEKVITILRNEFRGELSHTVFNEEGSCEHIDFDKYDIAKTVFQKYIVDASYVEKFDVEMNDFDLKHSSIITIYNTDEITQVLLEKIGIKVLNSRILNDTTVLLDENDIEILMKNAPYLVAMATENFTELAPSEFIEHYSEEKMIIPSPLIEPTIGVIDTLFDENVYFKEWVTYKKKIDDNIPIEPDDFKHGTAVTSIIVDGPSLNPDFDDGCGRFKVKHFGVATKNAFSSFAIIRKIQEIVSENKDIRVWNLSLGSNEEVNRNFISAEAAILDKIQFENDVIFVIAGTNKKRNEKLKKIGAPADSINSMVVNSVDSNNQPTSYTREGVVLSFFTKPDVSYYGGDNDKKMIVCEPSGKAYSSGTSYAAPWIARKLSYLIDILGFNREVAKAMIIDSAIGWNTHSSFSKLSLIGHGIVPIRIEDIIKTPDDEIKFFVSGESKKYDTFSYNFPVPIYKNEYPFIAKATLCYFPKCTRNQGVDYTNTELDLYFGRINDKDRIDSINKNKQSLEDIDAYITEEQARKLFRKWDNVKHISDEIKSNLRPRKVYENRLWGMSVKTKERLGTRDGEGIKFGVVVTLKEIRGVNRIDDFIQQCSLRGWLVNRVDVKNQIDIYNIANESIDLE